MTRIAFGEWLPDIPALQNSGALVAKNCIPQLVSYRHMRGLESFTNALTSACLGSVWARARNNDIFNFAGDAATLYRLDSGTTWTDVSKVAGYSAARWEFSQFGERVIAVDIADTPQYYDMNTSTLFADLPGSPPNAKHIGVVRDFVVLGNVDDGTARPTRVTWSGFNNSEKWTSSPQTQSGSQDLKGRGGPIRRVVEGDVGTIFQERSITRMTYVGPPIKFRFDEIERARGTAASDSVIWTGARCFYYATDGFYSLNLYGGQDSQPIGANRVNKWFRENASPGDIQHMRGAIDRENSLVMWAFKSSSSSTTNDRLLMYNWQADKWAYAEIEIQAFSEYASAGLSLDDLDTPFPNGIDIDSIAVDSTAFAGGNIGLLVFDNANQGATFSGPTLNVCLDTKEFGDDNALTFINGIRPLVEGTGVLSITPITRDRLIDNPVEGLPVAMNSIGICEVRTNARYHRYRLTGTNDFTHANGIEYQPKRKGLR